ncbi:Type I Iterative PKS [Bacidia gigantensis]|uniref:Type I Iterative PKS n=1 Tax=Bacidia gigantensis TaxID=2732470 RepID=UPI001D0590E9|nr:Type I Iterative PKS [Bacidia gigantensis]KAG8525582.1 Type I Iterative PKS [Bacidia gigantensis]
MAGPLSVFLFGDQDSQCRDHLGELMLTGSNPILNTFFDQAALSLRQEIQRLPWSQRDSFPSFSNFLDLLAIEASKPLHPGLQLALSTGDSRKSWETKNSVSSTSSYTFGLGTGLLAAAATSCYTNLEQFIPIALDTVLISFRIGLLAANTRDQIVDRADVGSWRIRVETDKPASVLSQVEDFCAQKHLQPWSKPYACDTSETSVLLGGPPATLEALTQAYSLKASPSAVYAPFHASTIYSENDVEAISQSFSPALTHVVSKLTLLSHHNGTALPPQTLPSLLRMAVRAILSESLASDAALHSIKGMTQSQASQPCTVISIGAPYGSRLESVLETTESSLERMTYVNDETIVSHATKAQYARQSKIAITGFSGRFPQAKNNEAFWDVIHNGVDTHAVTPKSRWDVKTHVDPTLKGKNTSAAAYGCWLDTPGAFDRSFFSISPREAPQMDPAQRLAMMCAYEAVEMSGIVTDSTPSTMKSRVGVFIGTTSSDWCETNSAQDVDNYFIPGGNRAFIPGRVNYYFKFSGPSFSVDTACSSSLAATHLACNALWRGDIDCAIIGGTNVLTNPDVTAGLDRGHFLSRTGNCKTFDDEADGYCRGEGTGIIVLKRLEDAQADNDPIHGCILAAATNHSAEAESITRPHVGAQRTLFSDVLAKGGVHPNDISYVEMHGTGTQAGDGREMASVSQTFAPWPQGDPRCRTNDLHVGSVKANVGHGEAAAGVTALIKVLLMMQKDEIPPHCGIKTKINQTFPPDLKERRVLIADRPKPWVRSNKPRRVLLNNFSAAGGNSCVLLEDGPGAGAEDLHTRPDTRPAHVVTLTAKSKTALEANTKSLASLLKSSNSISLSDLAYTSTARRLHYNFRASYPAQTIQELAASLERDTADPPQQARGAPKILFAFSGQGSTHAGMGRYLYETNSSFRTALDRFDTITQSQGFGSILPYIRGTGDANDESAASITQLSQVALQMALARLWDSWGISPAGVLGHSLGEYAALNFAGVLSDFDTLWVCGQRAKLLESHCKAGTHAMLAIRSSQADVDACLSGVATEIACMNGAQQTVISGSNADIDQASARLTSKGINFSRMKVPYAFHSSQLQPILGDFSKILNGITLRSPKVPIFSPLTSKVIKPGDEVDRDYLLRQCREAVNLVGAVQAGEDASLLNDRTHIIEIGPSNVLARLTQRATQHSPTIMPSLETNQDSWLVLSKSVAAAYRVGCNINWAQYHRDYDHAVIQLPSYNWDLKDYWIQYVNDWSLRKGDPLPIAAAASELQLTTTSCQKVISAKSEVMK